MLLWYCGCFGLLYFRESTLQWQGAFCNVVSWSKELESYNGIVSSDGKYRALLNTIKN